MERQYEGYWLPKGYVLAKKYRIEDVIEEGGMGVVYLAYDTMLQIMVSIKEYFPRRYAMRIQGESNIIPYQGNSTELYRQGLDKFVNEARILARFENIDCIVMVKEFFFANETAYFVMEHVSGENVKQWVEREGRMEPQRVLKIMRPILYAVNELHKEGLIHRDISPDNIILTEDDKGVLIDFGAARFSETQENRAMTVFFKRGYSAEEQYIEQAEKGAYTDVYSACATMYFMLTAIPPKESVRRLIRDTVVPLTKFQDIPLYEFQKRCIMKGMSVDVKKRYSTMEQLCQRLFADRKDRSKWIVSGCTILGTVLLAGGGSFAVQKAGKQDVQVRKVVSKDASSSISTKEVQETISSSPVLVATMPDVIGKKRVTAEKKLKAQGIAKKQIKIKWKYSAGKAKGRVVRQSIKKGTRLEEGKKYDIILTISKGERPKPIGTPTAKPTSKPVRKEKFDGKLPF